jgi:hypothetical protein
LEGITKEQFAEIGFEPCKTWENDYYKTINREDGKVLKFHLNYCEPMNLITVVRVNDKQAMFSGMKVKGSNELKYFLNSCSPFVLNYC